MGGIYCQSVHHRLSHPPFKSLLAGYIWNEVSHVNDDWCWYGFIFWVCRWNDYISSLVLWRFHSQNNQIHLNPSVSWNASLFGSQKYYYGSVLEFGKHPSSGLMLKVAKWSNMAKTTVIPFKYTGHKLLSAGLWLVVDISRIWPETGKMMFLEQ